MMFPRMALPLLASGPGALVKGCFAPWTPIAMGGGTEAAWKPIQAVRTGDRVLSWDEDMGELAEATVLGVEVAADWVNGASLDPPERLFEIVFNTTPPSVAAAEAGAHAAPSAPAAAAAAGGTAVSASPSASSSPVSLVLTADHPFYSARLQGLVSMEPLRTRERYGLAVGQMRSEEAVHLHSGGVAYARLRPWLSGGGRERDAFPVVTLRLDRHHWFFAQGVRVHNKGSRSSSRNSGGSSGGTTSMGGSRAVSRSPASYTAPLFATFLLSRSITRRRYGSYGREEDDCDLKNASQVDEACKAVLAPNASAEASEYDFSAATRPTSFDPGAANCSVSPQCCHECIACESEECIFAIASCDRFLKQAYDSCSYDAWVSNARRSQQPLFGRAPIALLPGLAAAAVGARFRS